MGHPNFDYRQNAPLFRPPKYTGITLSLLSIFVLVSMLAVWEKMVQVPTLPTLKVIAWEKAKVPLEQARLAFQNEESCIVHATYIRNEEFPVFLNSIDSSSKQKWDLAILPHAKDFLAKHPSPGWVYRDIIAYLEPGTHSTPPVIQDGSSVSLDSLLNQSSQESSLCIAFTRYLRAMNKGQVEFAMKGWTGVNDDPWARSPRFQLYADQKSQAWLEEPARSFAASEGMELSIALMESQNLNASLQILIQANNKNYLPDLVVFPTDLESPTYLLPYYKEVNFLSASEQKPFSFFIRKQSHLLKKIHKFLQFISDKK
jgi:hypothetical protein